VLTEDEVNLLAPVGHDRWSADMKTHLAWRRADGPKDEARKRHPLIDVPFDELPEDKEKDRDKVRWIPEILARAGFKIARTSQPTGPSGDGLVSPSVFLAR
jgi:hypothetical protein